MASDSDADPVVRPTPAHAPGAAEDGPDLALGASYEDWPQFNYAVLRYHVACGARQRVTHSSTTRSIIKCYKPDPNEVCPFHRYAVYKEYISPEYLTTAWRATHDVNLPLVGLEQLCPAAGVKPPARTLKRGKRVKNRMPSTGEDRATQKKVAKVQRCSLCKATGHNARGRNCPKANAPYVVDEFGDQRNEERARAQAEAARGRKRPRRGRAHATRGTRSRLGEEHAGMGPELPEFPGDSQVLDDEGVGAPGRALATMPRTPASARPHMSQMGGLGCDEELEMSQLFEDLE
jgi:hypothetical protein